MKTEGIGTFLIDTGGYILAWSAGGWQLAGAFLLFAIARHIRGGKE